MEIFKMGIAGTVAVQVLIMFILIFVGFVMSKNKLITETGAKQITNILLMVVTPCVLINAYQKDFEVEHAKGLLMASLLALLIHVAAILVSTLIFKKEETLKYRINIFSAVYSNCGFMAIPLMEAVLGKIGVFYGSAYLAVFTVLYWTHGVYVYTGSRKEVSFKKAFLNPGVLGTILSLLLFFLKIKLPYVIHQSVIYMAGLNTPLAMIVLGTYLVGIDFRKSLKNGKLFAVAGLRLILFPIVSVLIARLLNVSDEILRSIIIPAACPTAAVATLFAAKYNSDAKYASEIVAVTTLLSIITIPLIMLMC